MAKPKDILSYNANQIQVLEDLMAIRHNRSMYVGECALPGQEQICIEVCDNCKDEHELIEPDAPIEIMFCFVENTWQAIIQDRGRGIPVYDADDTMREPLREVTSKLHASGKFTTDGPYRAPTGTYGLGLKTAMGLSIDAAVFTSHVSGIGYVHYRQGNEVNYKIIENNGTPTGTIVIIQPDPAMFTEIDQFQTTGLERLITYMEFISVFIEKKVTFKISIYDNFLDLNKFWSKMRGDLSTGFKIIDNIKRVKTAFEYKDKITLEQYLKKKFEVRHKIVWRIPNIEKEFDPENPDDKLSYSIQLFLTENIKVNKGGVMATVNLKMINDPTSHHILVLSEVIKTQLEAMIPDTKMREYFKTLYKLPIYSIIRVRYAGASFLDQTKKGFKDPAFVYLYKNELMKNFETFDPSVWETLFELIYPDIESRYKDNFNKNYIGVKGLKNIGLYLKNSEGYKSCTSKDKTECELYIVEGKSAFDSCARACNNYYQAIFAQQGKPVNGFRMTEDEFLANIFIKDLMLILGITNRDTSLENMNFARIYILADADHHGYHICSLILGNLYQINPLILAEGRVHISNPPLYSLATTKTVIFLRDQAALMEIKVAALYKQTFTIHAVYKNSGIFSKITGEAFINLCHLVINVSKLIEEAASFVGMDTNLVELFLNHMKPSDGDYDIDLEELKENLEAQAISMTNDYITVSINELDLLIPWKRLKEECKKYLFYEYNKFKCKNFQLYITSLLTKTYDKTPISIVDLNGIMSKLDEKMGKFDHFKGLGEMEAKQLKETCFEPLTKSSIKITALGDVKVIYGMLDVDTTQRKELTT